MRPYAPAMASAETRPYQSRLVPEILAELGRRSWSKAQLAEAVGMVPNTLNRKLRGEFALDVDELARIAAALETTVGALTGRADQATP